MENPKKLATQGTQEEEKQNKATTQYVLETTIAQTSTHDINNTWVRLQTTGGKDEPNIAFIRTS